MIDAQQQPQMLVDYVRSDRARRAYAPRSWALRKASTLGVPRDELRAAVLELAGKIDDRAWLYVSLVEAKDEAMKLGILMDRDLPEVLSVTASFQELADVLRPMFEKARPTRED